MVCARGRRQRVKAGVRARAAGGRERRVYGGEALRGCAEARRARARELIGWLWLA